MRETLGRLTGGGQGKSVGAGQVNGARPCGFGGEGGGGGLAHKPGASQEDGPAGLAIRDMRQGNIAGYHFGLARGLRR